MASTVNKHMPQVHAENLATALATLPRAESNPKPATQATPPRRFPLLLQDQQWRHRRLCHSRCWAPACTPAYTAGHAPHQRGDGDARDFCAECNVSGRWYISVQCGTWTHGSPSRRVQKKFLEGLVAFDSWDPVGRTSKCLMHACRLHTVFSPLTHRQMFSSRRTYP
jgi:hypothetical protein